jgi:hypothetical protein
LGALNSTIFLFVIEAVYHPSINLNPALVDYTQTPSHLTPTGSGRTLHADTVHLAIDAEELEPVCEGVEQQLSNERDGKKQDSPILHIKRQRSTRRVPPGTITPSLILLTAAKARVYNTGVHGPLLRLMMHSTHAHARHAEVLRLHPRHSRITSISVVVHLLATVHGRWRMHRVCWHLLQLWIDGVVVVAARRERHWHAGTIGEQLVGLKVLPQ